MNSFAFSNNYGISTANSCVEIKPMIIAKISGGLGNQLFQYATARALSLRSNVGLALDLRLVEGQGPRTAGLQHFNISAPAAQAHHVPPERQKFLRYNLWRRLGIGGPRQIAEQGFGYNALVGGKLPDAYLNGFWQTERYFKEVNAVIRADLAFRTAPSPLNQSIIDDMRATPSISLHVRRGDYVTSARFSKTYAHCSIDYYRAGLEQIAKSLSSKPTLYIFSDDAAWVRENMQFDYATRYMDHNDTYSQAHEDLRLMAACQHHIIANSTFSWWGAWLNPSPEKIVIAPKQWYAPNMPQNPDIIPDGWRTL